MMAKKSKKSGQAPAAGAELAQRWRAEKEQAEKYLDIVSTIILALNKKGQVTLINRKGCEILAAPKAEILGQDWFANFLPPEARPAVEKVFQGLMAGREKEFAYFENEILAKNEQKKVIAWHNVLLKDEAGNIKGVLSSGQDITEKRKIESRLRDFVSKWEETINFLSSGISVHANDFTIIEVNKSLCRLLGKSRAQIIGRKCYQIFHNLSQPVKGCPLLKSIKTKKKESLEYYEPVLKRWLSVATVPILDARGEVKKTIHEVNDITERKQAEIEIKKRNQELEKANRLMVGRELKMVELKKEIAALKKRLNL